MESEINEIIREAQESRELKRHASASDHSDSTC